MQTITHSTYFTVPVDDEDFEGDYTQRRCSGSRVGCLEAVLEKAKVTRTGGGRKFVPKVLTFIRKPVLFVVF